MTTTTDRLAPGATTPSGHPTLRFRRIAGAVLLPLAFALQLGCNTIFAWISTESGLSDSGTNTETLEFYGRYPSSALAMTMLALLGVLVMIPGLIAALKALRPAKPRLALWAVVLMVAGYLSYFGVVMTNFTTIALAEYARDHQDVNLGAVLDAAPLSPLQMVFFGLFVIGNLVGTLLLGLAVILSRTIPWYAGALILCWTVGHLLNIIGGGEWFAVAGGALEVVGLAIVAAHILRTPDAEWAVRG